VLGVLHIFITVLKLDYHGEIVIKLLHVTCSMKCQR